MEIYIFGAAQRFRHWRDFFNCLSSFPYTFGQEGLNNAMQEIVGKRILHHEGSAQGRLIFAGGLYLCLHGRASLCTKPASELALGRGWLPLQHRDGPERGRCLGRCALRALRGSGWPTGGDTQIGQRAECPEHWRRALGLEPILLLRPQRAPCGHAVLREPHDRSAHSLYPGCARPGRTGQSLLHLARTPEIDALTPPIGAQVLSYSEPLLSWARDSKTYMDGELR